MLGSPQLGSFRGASFAMAKIPIPNGDAGIRATVHRMRMIVEGPEGVGSPAVRAAAIEAVRGSVRDVTEIDSIFNWVKRNIEFRDEAEETLQTPQVTLNLGAGDCDDHSMLLAALAGSLGYKTAFKTVAVARETPTDFTHVYAVVQDKRSGSWIPLDTTVRKSFAGWEPDDITRAEMYNMRGLRFVAPVPITGFPRPVRAGGFRVGWGSNPPTFHRPVRGLLGGLRRLGDTVDPISGEVYTDISSGTPIVEAPSGLDPTQQEIYDLAAPFAQAGASLLAHGQTPDIGSNLARVGYGLSSPMSPSIMTYVLLFGGVLVVAWAAFGRGR